MSTLYNLTVYITTLFFLYYLIKSLDIEENKYYDQTECIIPAGRKAEDQVLALEAAWHVLSKF